MAQKRDTSRYNEFPWLTIFGGILPSGAPAKPDIAKVLERDASAHTDGSQPAYVVVAPSMEAYNRAYGLTYASSFTTLLNSLARSKAWKLIYKVDGTFIYELPVAKPPQRASSACQATAGHAASINKTELRALHLTGVATRCWGPGLAPSQHLGPTRCRLRRSGEPERSLPGSGARLVIRRRAVRGP